MVVQTQTAAADGSLTGKTPDGDTLRVREVWQHNLEEEMQVRVDGIGVPRTCPETMGSGVPSRTPPSPAPFTPSSYGS